MLRDVQIKKNYSCICAHAGTLIYSLPYQTKSLSDESVCEFRSDENLKIDHCIHTFIYILVCVYTLFEKVYVP